MTDSQAGLLRTCSRRLAIPLSEANNKEVSDLVSLGSSRIRGSDHRSSHNRQGSYLGQSRISTNEEVGTNQQKLEIKPNIRSIHAYTQHLDRNISPQINNQLPVNGADQTVPLQTRDDILKNFLNKVENVFIAQEPEVDKNPVVVGVTRVTNPEIEIRPLKEDLSLKNRNINDDAKMKRRRRRSSSRNKSRQKLSAIDVATNGQGFCSLNSVSQRNVGAYRPDGSNRYGRTRSIEYKDESKDTETSMCRLI